MILKPNFCQGRGGIPVAHYSTQFGRAIPFENKLRDENKRRKGEEKRGKAKKKRNLIICEGSVV